MKQLKIQQKIENGKKLRLKTEAEAKMRLQVNKVQSLVQSLVEC